MSQQRSPLPAECMAIDRSNDSDSEGDSVASSDYDDDTDAETRSPSLSPGQTGSSTAFKAEQDGKLHFSSNSEASGITRININASSVGGLQAGATSSLQGVAQSSGGLLVRTGSDSGNVTPR